MSDFDEYSQKYQSIRMERRSGILQVTLHTNGDTLQWGAIPHAELPQAFRDIGSDYDNKVVILTGTGRVSPAPGQLRHTGKVERLDSGIKLTGKVSTSG